MVINERIQFEKGWYLLYIMVNINSSMPGNRPPLIRHSDSLYLVVWSTSHLPHPPQDCPGPQFMNGQGSLDSADKGPSLTGTSRPTPLSIRLHAVKSAAYYLNTWHGPDYQNILSYTQTHSPSPLSPNGYWIGLSYHMALVVKSLLASAGDIRDVGSIPGSGRSPEGANGNPLQYSCLENPMDRGAWRAVVQRVAKSRAGLKRLNTHTCSPSLTDLHWTGLLSLSGSIDILIEVFKVCV